MNDLMDNSPPPQRIPFKVALLNEATKCHTSELFEGDLVVLEASPLSIMLKGRRGIYEIFDGDVISFKPHTGVKFMLISGETILTGSLDFVELAAAALYRVGEPYEISILDGEI